jgi:hypothetical protein
VSRWRWLIWTVFLIAWTIALLFPIQPRTGAAQIDEAIRPYRYAVAKTVHVSAYAVLTILTGWLRVAVRYRFLFVFLLMVHGTVTEMGQHAMAEMGRSERHGDLYDVGYDNLGVLLGLLASWKFWVQEK